MKRGIWVVVLVISLGVNIGFLLHRFWPQEPDGRGPAGPHSESGWHVSAMRRGLGLNAKQVQLMEGERRQVMAQARPLQDELRLKRRELYLLLRNTAVSDLELDGALNGISRLQTAIEKMFILHTTKVKGFFTPQQLQKYEGFFEQGLCPGMMSEQACPPVKMAGGDCIHAGKKENSKR